MITKIWRTCAAVQGKLVSNLYHYYLKWRTTLLAAGPTHCNCVAARGSEARLAACYKGRMMCRPIPAAVQCRGMAVRLVAGEKVEAVCIVG